MRIGVKKKEIGPLKRGSKGEFWKEAREEGSGKCEKEGTHNRESDKKMEREFERQNVALVSLLSSTDMQRLLPALQTASLFRASDVLVRRSAIPALFFLWRSIFAARGFLWLF